MRIVSYRLFVHSSMYNSKLLILFTVLVNFKEYYCQFQFGKKLINPFTVLAGPYGRKQCIEECLLRRRCQTVGYNRELLKCELSSFQEIANISDFSYTIAFRSDLMEYQILLGGCSNHECDIGQKCEARRHDLHECIRSDCGPPPNVPNANTSNSQSNVGQNITYTCIVGELIGNENVICKANGQWTDIAFQCQMAEVSTPNDDNDGYELRTWQDKSVRIKVLQRGKKSTSYSTAVSVCRENGGRLLIINEGWKLDATVDVIDKDPSNGHVFFVNGEETNGRWKTSDGNDLVILSGGKYDLKFGRYVAVRSNKRFVAVEAAETRAGCICEKI